MAKMAAKAAKMAARLARRVVFDDSWPRGRYDFYRVCNEDELDTFFAGLTPVFCSDD